MPSPGSGRGPGSKSSSQSGPPSQIPNIPSPPPSGTEDRFTLQLLVELQRAVADISAKTDRLIKDVESQSNKLDAVRQQISFAKGAVWVIGALMALIAGTGLYFRFSPPADRAAFPAERPQVSAPAQVPQAAAPPPAQH